VTESANNSDDSEDEHKFEANKIELLRKRQQKPFKSGDNLSKTDSKIETKGSSNANKSTAETKI